MQQILKVFGILFFLLIIPFYESVKIIFMCNKLELRMCFEMEALEYRSLEK